MQSFLKSAARWLNGSKEVTRNSRHSGRYRRVSLEALEERRVLSSDFITALYQDVLHRAPDPDGKAYFENLLATGTLPSDVVNAVWQSAEHRGIEIDSYYQALLHRAPDAAGRQVWVTNMVNGMTEETVIAGFLTSPEYNQEHPGQTPYVDALYQDMFGRAPDPSGVSSWLVILNSRPGTTPGPLSAVDEAYVLGVQQAQVARAFVSSIEYVTIVVDSYYSNYLQRPPDSAGETYWVQQLTQGLATEQTAAENFLSSQEYLADHPI